MDERIVELHSAAEIRARVASLAAEIKQFYASRDPLLLCSLENGFVFFADLLRELESDLVSGYLHTGQRSGARVQDLSFRTTLDVAGRDILLVEGVMDTGITIDYVADQLGAHGAASVKTCVLIDKPENRRIERQPDWRAFVARNQYVFGYGLDFQGRWRGLPYLATLDEEA